VFVVVLGDGRDDLGVSVDAVDEVRSLGRGELSEPSGVAEGLGRHLVLGLTDDALLVLDGGEVLRDERLVIDQGEDVTG
jgi:chemotaxis signal transduction protein